jgi:hypothetical protein
MEDNFNNQIKNLLEGSQPHGTGPVLDKDALWNRIEQKQKNKTIPFKKWASHAAAAIIGIIICLPFLFHNNKTVTKTITRLQPASTKIVTDTVFLKQTPQLASGQVAPLKPKALQPATVKPPVVVPQTEVALRFPEHDTVMNIVPAALLAQATTGHARSKALHVKDIGNENAVHQFRPVDKPSFIERLAARDQTQIPSESVSAIIDQQFFTSNN